MSKKLLGKTLERYIVPVEIGIHGMVNVGDVVFHTDIPSKNK